MNAKKHQQSEISMNSDESYRDEILERMQEDDDSYINHCDISEVSQVDMLPSMRQTQKKISIPREEFDLTAQLKKGKKS